MYIEKANFKAYCYLSDPFFDVARFIVTWEKGGSSALCTICTKMMLSENSKSKNKEDIKWSIDMSDDDCRILGLKE